ncbi:hypothetical protein DFH06DRAFT_1344247 [Mycena polygramma]|nr:hypothetical protein DFH06DRAFT_1344247 [Mycena polygramma]
MSMPSDTQPTPTSEAPDVTVIAVDTDKEPNAVWTKPEVYAFLDHLIKNVAKAGLGGNFKTPVYTAAAKMLNQMRTVGGRKKAKGCLNKYTALRATYKVIDHLVNYASGFTYSDDKGANIGPAEKDAWDAYVKVHTGAKPFRNKGWPYRAKMAQLVPSQAKGNHVFRTPQAAARNDQLDVGSFTGDPPHPAIEEPHSPTPWDMEDPKYRAGNSDDDDDEQEKEKEQELDREQSNSPTPVGSGRKRAAATPSHPPKRIRPTGGAQALASIANAAQEFNDIFGDFRSLFATPKEVAAAPSVPAAAPAAAAGPAAGFNAPLLQPSPVRKTSAVIRAQELETYLVPSDLAILIDILGESASKADMYNAIRIDAVRVGWVQAQLRKHTEQQGLDFSF